MTDPSWRVVFNTPEAAPAIAGLISRMATVVMGAKTSPRPTPVSTKGKMKMPWAEVVVASAVTIAAPAPKRARPAISRYFPPKRSARRPAKGATIPAVRDMGANVKPDCNADMPSTDWV